MKKITRIGVIAVLIQAVAIFSNPFNPINEFPLISEIQYEDSVHWSMELDILRFKIEMLKLTPPCSTDIFTLQQSPQDTNQKKSMIWINDQGIGVITQNNFPKYRFRKGEPVLLLARNEPNKVLSSMPTIPDIKPNQSMISVYYRIFQIHSGSSWGCAAYTKDNTPSIGVRNDSTNIFSTIYGIVLDKNKIPVPSVCCELYDSYSPMYQSQPVWSNKTDGSGAFRCPNFLSYQTLIFKYDQQAVAFRRPEIQPDSTAKVEILLDQVDAPTPMYQYMEKVDHANLRFLSLHKIGSNVAVCFSINNQNRIYTTPVIASLVAFNGKIIRSLTCQCPRTGTYSVIWDGRDKWGKRVAFGNYTCTIRHFNSSAVQNFIFIP